MSFLKFLANLKNVCDENQKEITFSGIFLNGILYIKGVEVFIENHFHGILN